MFRAKSLPMQTTTQTTGRIGWTDSQSQQRANEIETETNNPQKISGRMCTVPTTIVRQQQILLKRKTVLREYHLERIYRLSMQTEEPSNQKCVAAHGSFILSTKKECPNLVFARFRRSSSSKCLCLYQAIVRFEIRT